MNKKAFSLVELVMVIMFLGILAVVAAVAVNGVFKKGTEQASDTMKRSVALMIQDYLTEDYVNGLPDGDDSPGQNDKDHCVVITPSPSERCELTELKDSGQIKASICDSVNKKEIDLANTKFDVTYDSVTQKFVCDECVLETAGDLANFDLKLTNTECGI